MVAASGLLLLLRGGNSGRLLLLRRPLFVKVLVPRRGFDVAAVFLERLRSQEAAEGVRVLFRRLFLVVVGV